MEPITVPGNADSLELITAYVLNVASEAGLTNSETYRLRLAIDEIATNIITHGYAKTDEKRVLTVQGFIKINKIIVQVEDFGAPFDPTRAFCKHNIPLSSEQLSTEGGLGIFLALSSIDNFYYENRGTSNRCTFILYTRR